MLNIDGNRVEQVSSISSDFQNLLLNGTKLTEVVRFQSDIILFWEAHYFRIMASLRQLRFEIPIHFTMDFLETEILKTIEWSIEISNNALISLHFFSPLQKNTTSKENTSFLIEANTTPTFQESLPLKECSIDLYRDSFVLAGKSSNISGINRTLHAMAIAYADENKWDACLLLNHNKHICESTSGTIYLIQESQVVTPPLTSGCQNLVFRKVFNQWVQKNTEYELIEREIIPFEMQTATEVFTLSLEKGNIGITKYRKTSYPKQLGTVLFKSFLKNEFIL